MKSWKVEKYVRENGNCPIDDWLESRDLNEQDRAAVEARLLAIEGHHGPLPPKWTSDYRTTSFREIRIKGHKKQLRPLYITLPVQRIVVLVGAIEKGGKLPKGDINRAEQHAKDLRNGKGTTKGFWED